MVGVTVGGSGIGVEVGNSLGINTVTGVLVGVCVGIRVAVAVDLFGLTIASTEPIRVPITSGAAIILVKD